MKAGASLREVLLKERESLIQEIQDEQQALLGETPEEALIWQALVPWWTVESAEACNFPTANSTTVAETLRRIEVFARNDFTPASTLVDVADDDTSPALSERSFEMPNSARAEILQRVVHDTSRGLPYLQQTIKLISDSLQKAESLGLSLPDTVHRWAILASMAQSSSQLAKWLEQKTDELLDQSESGELLRWIEVARPLEELLGSEITAAIRRSTRLLELHHRLKDDKRHLEKFLIREEQIKAFEDLLNNTTGEWALHYIGSGGMGKTMLIRYLAADRAQQLQASTARIDFDYLNPDYPAHAPGLLLAQLAEEFRVHDHTGAATSSFVSFIEKVSNLHEQLSVRSSSTQMSLEAVMAPIYEQLPLFVDGLNQLPKPIIIILDTCEELAKIRVDGTTPPSVQATFGILERLHEMQPDVRVIFGGRRPLASVGAGWRCPGSELLPRPYLRVHEIRGFTVSEATKYLTEIEKVRPDSVKPIIKHSRIKKNVASRLEWNGVGPNIDKVERYHPFDLSLYAAWIHEDPDLPVSALKTADADRYIDMRIVRRLRHPRLVDLLPSVALLGRFDFNTLRVVSGMDETSFSKLFNELSDQEWINRQASNFLEVDQGLQPRLLAYYQRTKPIQTENARSAIVNHLEKVTIDDERSKLTDSHFRAAFRLLKPEPVRAALWWEKVETRFAEEEAYDWLRNICEGILGDEDDVQSADDSTVSKDAEGPNLSSAVRVSYASALTHIGPFDKIEATWKEVLLHADKHPIPRLVARLIQRAQAGQLSAAARYNPEVPKGQQIHWLWETLQQLKDDELDSQLAASFIAAAEATLELLETPGQMLPLNARPLIHFSNLLNEPTGNQELAWFANALTGRLLALSGHLSDAEFWFRRSLLRPRETSDVVGSQRITQSPKASEPTSEPLQMDVTAQTWLDWRAPSQLRPRIRLEFIRSMYPFLAPADILFIVGNSVPAPATIDSDRLGSAILQLRAATGPLISKDIEELAQQSRYSIQHEPSCNAHREFPPLFAMVAEAIASEGKVDKAVKTLSARSITAESVEHFATVLEADRACLRIARRMRLRDEDIGSNTSVHSSLELQDLNLLWAIQGLSNPKKDASLEVQSLLDRLRNPQDRLALLHARFRSTYTLRPEMANTLITWSTQFMPPAEPLTANASFAEVSCFFDCLEVNRLGRWRELDRPFPKLRIGQVKETKLWRDQQSDPIEKLTVMLRHASLDASPSTIMRLDRVLVQRVGYRRAARIALDEGELLALRLPARAARLLDQSYRWFVRAKDYRGALIAKIAFALAVIQSGQNASLARALKRIQKDFNWAQASFLTDLPKWETLTSIAESPQSKSLSGLTPIGWRPWLVRLIAALVWQKDGYRPRERSQLLARWIGANYGITSESETSLPAELHGWLTADIITNLPTRKSQYLSINLAKRSRGWQSLENTPEVFLRLQGEGRQALQRVTVQGLNSYRIAAQDLLDQLDAPDSLIPAEVLASLTGEDVILLKVDHPSSWICWEGILGYALQEIQQVDAHELRFQRTVSEAKTKRSVQWNRVKNVLIWANDLHAADVARTGWNPIVEFGDLWIVDSESMNFRKYAEVAQVIHVIGALIETSAGIRVDLSSTRVWRQETKGTGGGSGSISSLNLESAPPPGKADRGNLLKAFNLYSMFPNMALCILQAPPRAKRDFHTRTQSDREHAAYLRLFGAELVGLGVPVVITIPELDSDITPFLLNDFVDSLLYFQGKAPVDPFLVKTWSSKPPVKRWSTKRAVPAFLSAVETVQRRIRNLPVFEEEVAFDVCLYAADVKH